MPKIRPLLYFVLVAFLLTGLLYPWIGVIALLCMIAPVAVAYFRGRYWCGNFCPRGSLFDRVIAKISFKRPIPRWMMTSLFRYSAFSIIMALFSLQMVWAWGDWQEIGKVFLRVIFLTTVAGIVLGVRYNQRTWCVAVCPMGTLANLASRCR